MYLSFEKAVGMTQIKKHALKALNKFNKMRYDKICYVWFYEVNPMLIHCVMPLVCTIRKDTGFGIITMFYIIPDISFYKFCMI